MADYTGVKSNASNYLEIAVAVVEAVLLFGFAIPLWAARVDGMPPASEALVVQVTGEQFAWNIHYAGPDGVFGRTDIKLLDLQSNPLGLDRSDPAAKDDVTTVNQLYLPVNTPIIVRLRSKDVIHSFGVPEFRVKQDAIPGLTIPIWFVPTVTTAEMRTRTGQAALAHLDPGGARHPRSRRTRSRRSPSRPPAPCPCCRRTPSNLSSQCSKPSGTSPWPERTAFVARIPRDHGLRAGAARADVPTRQDVHQRGLRASVGERGHQLGALGQHAPRRARRARRARISPAAHLFAASGHELQRAHAARADVAEPFDRVEALRRAALGGEPDVDERTAEAVRQGIREHPRQARESWPVESVGKGVGLPPQGHRERRGPRPAARERGVVLEDGRRLALGKRDEPLVQVRFWTLAIGL